MIDQFHSSFDKLYSILEPIIILIGFNGSTLAKIILMIVVNGMASTIPHGPHTRPQKIKATKINNALRFKLEAINFGFTSRPIMP